MDEDREGVGLKERYGTCGRKDIHFYIILSMIMCIFLHMLV